ncbi:tripartite motif-containing protein 3-like [Branchiostoma lanceolatum]|uniref:tripartite motif-containing protein 3-like n=1 Tax=Branchiostoma lanceolatum TaxID=7740 RepID=UPI0034565716
MAEAVQSSLCGKLREELSCSICLELFYRPKVLPCKHTFCQDCLLDWAGGQECFKCPVCHLWAEPPAEGVPDLPDGRLVENLCEQIRIQAAVMDETAEQPHLAHMCSRHPQVQLKLYCNNCHIAICSACPGKVHAGHRTVNLEKALEERITEDRGLIVEGRTMLETYCDFIIGLRGTEKKLEEQKQQTECSITQAYNQILQKLREAKDDMLSKVEQKHKQNVDAIQSQREGILADLSELSAACDSAELNIQKRGMGILEQDTGLIKVVGKYRDRAAPSPIPTDVAVFQPTDITSAVQTLGQVNIEPLKSALLKVAHRQEPIGSSGGESQKKDLPKRITFGGKGVKKGKFTRPLGVAVSGDGHIFVADCGNDRIQVFNLQGTFVHSIVTRLSGHSRKTMGFAFQRTQHRYNEVMSPHDVAIDGDANLWVVGDTDISDFAVKYTTQGSLLAKIELQKTRACRGIAVDTRRDRILVTQTVGTYLEQGVVQEFRSDGTLVKIVGKRQGMNHPQYITVDREGNILVSDYFSDCVYVYDNSGSFKFKFGDRASSEHRLKYPRGICTDSSGNIVVADGRSGCLEVFDKTGRFVKSITTDSSGPCAVAMAKQGHLVVTDEREDTVTIFEKLI